jgi:hypothetical protein
VSISSLNDDVFDPFALKLLRPFDTLLALTVFRFCEPWDFLGLDNLADPCAMTDGED